MRKKILLSALAILLIMQIFKIDKTNPETNPEYDLYASGNLNPEIGTLLKEACNDCHSNYTKYPWYTNVEPISWFVKGHIKHGRATLNFSEWHSYSEAKKKHLAEEAVEVLEDKRMPMKSYTWMHEQARLTTDQRNSLINYFKSIQG